MLEMREIEPGKISPELIGCLIVSQSRLFGGIEGAEPEAGSVLWESDLSNPFAPMPLSHSSVEFCGLRRSAYMFHWNGFGAQEVEGALVLALPLA